MICACCRERKEADRQVFGNSVNPFFTQKFVREVSSAADGLTADTELCAAATTSGTSAAAESVAIAGVSADHDVCVHHQLIIIFFYY